MISNLIEGVDIWKADSHWCISFTAMASPCELLVRSNKTSEVRELASLAFTETRRIEQKFSRYKNDNIVYAINQSAGKPIQIDDETLHLLMYAGDCYELSEGMFDITSGILRKAWKFDSFAVTPDQKLIDSLLALVGWEKVQIADNELTLKPGMEIDFGGIGKEYTVDRVAQMLFEAFHFPLMVNFGGDIRAMNDDIDADPWLIGIEDPNHPGLSIRTMKLVHGAIATSGVSYRHCFVNGRRLGHILNPKTGWPVEDTPQSVTVTADFCTEAGLLSTLAMLHGKDAEAFLQNQGVPYHCIG